MYVSLSNLIRWGGLVALVAAALLIIADLITVVSAFGQGSMEGLIFRAALSASAGALLALGLVSLQARTYPRMATILLIVGAVLTGVINIVLAAVTFWGTTAAYITGVGALADI